MHNVTTKATKRGTTIYIGGRSIGSVNGSVYEKQGRPMYSTKSINLGKDELEAAAFVGARFLRQIADGRTYTVALVDFRKYARSFSHAVYGDQWACPLDRFQVSSAVVERNAVLDNPIPERPQERTRQLSLFEMFRFSVDR